MSKQISIPQHEVERVINVLRYGAHPHPSPHADYLATLLAQPQVEPVPAGYIVMPCALSAENGAKAALTGEFRIGHETTCSGCYYDDEPDEECEVCGGEVTYTEHVTVPWDTIKEVYAAAVKRCASPIAQNTPQASLAIPEECPHMIVFDDADRQPLMFAGAGSRPAALKTFKQISQSWNAHLFARIAGNSRDDRHPSATVHAPQPAQSELAIRLNRVVAELKGGFFVCRSCGDQEDTATLDCVPELESIAAALVRANLSAQQLGEDAA
ncbi:hypothetical protein [Pseudomonas sp. Choline-3u-10]|uniref:hypothetical protein n=1 Tax=Pseudomonas sp. Choline-3u-10 TaxID=2058311 RepID=UPI0015B1FD86|nr:hypothetical protein [Pseudomonas sp. Choline-3u-10]